MLFYLFSAHILALLVTHAGFEPSEYRLERAAS